MNNLKALHISSCHIVGLSLEEHLTRLLSGWASMFGEEQALDLKSTILQLVKEAGMKSKEIHLPVSSTVGLSKKSGRKRRDGQHKPEHIHIMSSPTDLTMDNLSQSLNLDNILCKLSTLHSLCLHKIHNISVLQE